VNIIRLFELGITTGCAPDQYCPDRDVTRGQMATFLARMLNLSAEGTDWFDDNNGDVHEPAINALADLGISNTCGQDSYCPDSAVTRDDMALFMVRAYDLPASNELSFDDVTANHHETEIRALAAAGITFGCGENVFCPDNPVNRGQMASFLIRAVDWLAARE